MRASRHRRWRHPISTTRLPFRCQPRCVACSTCRSSMPLFVQARSAHDLDALEVGKRATSSHSAIGRDRDVADGVRGEEPGRPAADRTRGTTAAFRGLTSGTAALSLIAGAVAILAVMLLSVRERVRRDRASPCRRGAADGHSRSVHPRECDPRRGRRCRRCPGRTRRGRCWPRRSVRGISCHRGPPRSSAWSVTVVMGMLVGVIPASARPGSTRRSACAAPGDPGLGNSRRPGPSASGLSADPRQRCTKADVRAAEAELGSVQARPSGSRFEEQYERQRELSVRAPPVVCFALHSA